MNILVISDTHGNTETPVEIYERYKNAMSLDMIIHCGDYVRDAEKIEKATGARVVSVPGNCDGCRSRRYEVLDTPGGRILVTHGYAEDVKAGSFKLYLLALQENCRAACFGHTHIPVVEQFESVLLVNPGSLSEPRGAERKPSCAVISSGDNGIKASIIYHDEI